MPLTPTKYDKIYVKSRNPYKTPKIVRDKVDRKEVQMRIYYQCESEFFTTISYKHMINGVTGLDPQN